MLNGRDIRVWACQSIILLVTILATVASAWAQTTIEGRWLTEEKSGVVEIYSCGDGAFCGRLLWVRIKPSDRNPHALDNRNSMPALRDRPLCGLVMMWGFRPNGENQWSDGSLYDPESGSTYRGKMTLRPDGTLSLRGYVGISLFGRSQDWTRFTHSIFRCPAE
jgi:uncharacterized protein (DUF2147 family)